MIKKSSETSFLFILNFIFACILSSAAPAQTYSGLPTRSQHPMLQSYFIPAIPITSEEKWNFSQSLYITNTYQQEDHRQEQVEIDVENTRFDFQATYNYNAWYFNINVPYISNQSGSLDSTINDWHDFFNLPQGGRDETIDDQLRLYYKSGDKTYIDIDQPGAGLADIQFALGYQLDNSTQAWFALEIPSSNSSPLISNDAVDVALWISKYDIPFELVTGYFTLGLALPADEGILKGALRDQIIFAQFGVSYEFNSSYQLLFQTDFHSEVLKSTNLEALSTSLQGQFVLRLNNLFGKLAIDLFFSEDIYSGHAPDITFGLRISPTMKRN